MASATATATKKQAPIISRGWMITINNPKIPGDAYLAQWMSDGHIVFGCGQLERAPETGTPHLQMYIVTKANEKNPKGFSRKWVSTNIHSNAYLAKREGTHAEARDYCTLPEYKGKAKEVLAGPWTVGEWSDEEGPKKGGKAAGAKHKLNVESMLKEVKDGKSDLYLMEKYPHLFMSMNKGIEKARLIYANEHPRQQPDVFVYWGATGTGKSHTANQIMINNGGGHVFRKGNQGNMWADGYDPIRHPVVWFDEMDGGFMTYRMLLRICDKWPLTLDTKGGAVNFNPKIIVFTSSKHPKEWYSITAVPDTTELMRRLSGEHGMVKQLTVAFAAPLEVGPSLESREQQFLAGITRAPVLSNSIPVGVDEAPPKMSDITQEVVDLTCDEELSNPTPPSSDDEIVDLECVICGADQDVSCECFDYNASGDRDDTDSIEGDGYLDEDMIALREAQRLSVEEVKLKRANAMTAQTHPLSDAEYWAQERARQQVTPATSAPAEPMAPRKRGAAELLFEPPPKAPASEFKKYKQVPGQSRLVTKPWRDDDDE